MRSYVVVQIRLCTHKTSYTYGSRQKKWSIQIHVRITMIEIFLRISIFKKDSCYKINDNIDKKKSFFLITNHKLVRIISIKKKILKKIIFNNYIIIFIKVTIISLIILIIHLIYFKYSNIYNIRQRLEQPKQIRYFSVMSMLTTIRL